MKLSPREKQILKRLALGETMPAAAAFLGISPHTANCYLRRAFLKLGVHNATAAIVRAMRHSNPALRLSLD